MITKAGRSRICGPGQPVGDAGKGRRLQKFLLLREGQPFVWAFRGSDDPLVMKGHHLDSMSVDLNANLIPKYLHENIRNNV